MNYVLVNCLCQVTGNATFFVAHATACQPNHLKQIQSINLTGSLNGPSFMSVSQNKILFDIPKYFFINLESLTLKTPKPTLIFSSLMLPVVVGPRECCDAELHTENHVTVVKRVTLTTAAGYIRATVHYPLAVAKHICGSRASTVSIYFQRIRQ